MNVPLRPRINPTTDPQAAYAWFLGPGLVINSSGIERENPNISPDVRYHKDDQIPRILHRGTAQHGVANCTASGHHRIV